MKVDYAFVAEAADSQGGLFYVTRGGADIYVLPRDFPRPLRLGALSVVLRVIGDPADIGKTLSFACAIVDGKGESVNFDQEIQARFDPHPIDPARANGSVLAFRFYGFPVPEFGPYAFEVRQDGRRLVEVPFWVVPADEAPAGMTGLPGGAGEQPEAPSTGYL